MSTEKTRSMYDASMSEKKRNRYDDLYKALFAAEPQGEPSNKGKAIFDDLTLVVLDERLDDVQYTAGFNAYKAYFDTHKNDDFKLALMEFVSAACPDNSRLFRTLCKK